MARNFILMNLTFAFVAIFCSCSSSNRTSDPRCPELVEKANYQNAQYGDKEGPMGMKMNVEYIDSVYRIIQIVDESIIPSEKLKMYFGYMKSNAVAGISSAKGDERHDYQLMVDNNIWFEHIIKSKNTGNVIVRTTLSPKDIADALEHKLTNFDELKMWVNNISQNTLPREMEPGYTMKSISCTEKEVNIEILIDEKQKDFDEATIIRQWSKEQQAITLADLTTGLTFHQIASNVPIAIVYHFIGSNGNNELTISFSAEEVVKYNDVMERIKEQQYK